MRVEHLEDRAQRESNILDSRALSFYSVHLVENSSNPMNIIKTVDPVTDPMVLHRGDGSSRTSRMAPNNRRQS